MDNARVADDNGAAGQILEYERDRDLRPPRPWRSLPGWSLVLAVLSGPLGAATSIFLHFSGWVSFDTSERGGFLFFAVGEGTAAALACLAWVRLRRAPGRFGDRGRRGIVYAAAVLSAAGCGAVLALIFNHAIR